MIFEANFGANLHFTIVCNIVTMVKLNQKHMRAGCTR